jgi:hypothetical protein
MALQLPDNDQAPFYILGKDAKGLLGAPLAAGASCAVTSADPNTVVVAQDASPAVTPAGLVDANGNPVPAGLQCVASGLVSTPAAIAAPNTAITLTAAVTNADASAGPTISDTVTVIPGLAASIGDVFGPAVPVPVPVAPPAA